MFNFRQRHEAFLNTDTRRFKISDERHGTPPWQVLLSFHLHLSVHRQIQLGRFKSLRRCLVHQIFFKLHCCDPWSFIFAVPASFQAVLSTGFFFFAMCKIFSSTKKLILISRASRFCSALFCSKKFFERISIGINFDRIKQREDTAEPTKETCHNVRTNRLSVLSGLSEKNASYGHMLYPYKDILARKRSI